MAHIIKFSPPMTLPHPVVTYMCRESICSYLKRHTDLSVHGEIYDFVIDGKMVCDETKDLIRNLLLQVRTLILHDDKNHTIRNCYKEEIGHYLSLVDKDASQDLPKPVVRKFERIFTSRVDSNFDIVLGSVLLAIMITIVKSGEYAKIDEELLKKYYPDIEQTKDLPYSALQYALRCIKGRNGEAYLISHGNWAQRESLDKLRNYLVEKRGVKSVTLFCSNRNINRYDPDCLTVMSYGNAGIDYREASSNESEEESCIHSLFYRDFDRESWLSYEMLSARPWPLYDFNTRKILNALAFNLERLGRVATFTREPEPNDLVLKYYRNYFYVELEVVGKNEDEKHLSRAQLGLKENRRFPYNSTVVSALLQSRLFYWYYFMQSPRQFCQWNNIIKSRVEKFPVPSFLDEEEVLVIESLYLWLQAKHFYHMPEPMEDVLYFTDLIRTILDLVIYQIYFPEEFNKCNLEVTSVLSKFIKKCSSAQEEFYKRFYDWFLEPENPVRDAIVLMEVRSHDFLFRIHSFQPK